MDRYIEQKTENAASASNEISKAVVDTAIQHFSEVGPNERELPLLMAKASAVATVAALGLWVKNRLTGS